MDLSSHFAYCAKKILHMYAAAGAMHWQVYEFIVKFPHDALQCMPKLLKSVDSSRSYSKNKGKGLLRHVVQLVLYLFTHASAPICVQPPGNAQMMCPAWPARDASQCSVNQTQGIYIP